MMPDTFVDAQQFFDLRGKCALVTGAAGGIGRAIAEGLASVGVVVALADRLADGLRETEQAITGRGFKAVAIPVDLSHPQARTELVEKSRTALSRIDILVNCAGVTRGAPSETYSPEDWDHTLSVNLTATFHLCQLAAQDMLPRRAGSIINVASIAGVLGFPNNPAYQASKSGVIGLTRALANDWGKFNIRVNSISPGYTHTAMTDASFREPHAHAARASRAMMQRWARTEEMVGPVIFLASEAASYVTGANLFVDGGWAAAGLTE